MTEIRVNGCARRVDRAASIADLVREAVDDPERAGIAVALNREVVPRSRWADVTFSEGDELEIVAPFQGG